MAGIAVVTPSWADTTGPAGQRTHVDGYWSHPGKPRNGHPGSYAALGDSFSSGVGTGSYKENDPCQHSDLSAAALWVASHPRVAFTFAACSGATTSDVINTQVGALKADTTQVTITIGGNDAGFVPVLETCVQQNDDACTSAVNQAEAYVNTTLPGQLDATYAAIHAKAPKAKLYVLGYPREFSLAEPCDASAMGPYRRGLLNGAADVLDEKISNRASAAGATFIDVRSIFAGHEVCSGDPWINGIVSPITDSFHPNKTGYSSGYLKALVSFTG